MRRRILIRRLRDYAWPWIALLQLDEDGDWVEEDAWGGDSAEEALETLRAENRRARGVPVEGVAA